MTKRALIAALVPVCLASAGLMVKAARISASMPPLRQEVRLTCDQFDLTAQELRASGGDDRFLTMLSETCRGAMASVETHAEAHELASAWVLLDRLSDFRETIRAMNHAHLRDAARGAPLRLVSITGAYLIAREMGLFALRDTWVEAAHTDIAKQ